MSDDKEEDNKIKKTLANIAFGLVAKSFNRKTVSKMFDGIKEALHHQKIYDVMDEVEMEKYWEWRELDDNWTIGFEDGRPHFQHKYGGISYSHFDYKLRMVRPIGIIKMKIIKNISRQTQTANTTLSARQERER